MEKNEDSKSISEFKEEIDTILSDLLSERQKVQSALRDKNYHASYASRKIKENLKLIIDKNKDNHAQTVADVIQLIPGTIIECFNYLENLDENIGVALNAYTNAMNVYIKSSETSESLSVTDNVKPDVKNHDAEENQKVDKKIKELKSNNKQQEMRKIGERPKDKLKDRKTKNPVSI